VLVRIASDISPLQLQRYEQHPDPANLDQFSALSERLLSLLPESRKTKITLVTESRAARETFPIHRSINSGRLDWFATFGQLLFQLNTVPDPRLPSRLFSASAHSTRPGYCLLTLRWKTSRRTTSLSTSATRC
jgi:hypothetical protein